MEETKEEPPSGEDVVKTSQEKESEQEKPIKCAATTLGIPRISSSVIYHLARLHGFTKEAPSTSVPLHIEAADCLATLAEFRLRQVIQEARKFAIHSCSFTSSTPLRTRDIENGMKVLRMEPLWGYGVSRSPAYWPSFPSFMERTSEENSSGPSVVLEETKGLLVNTSHVASSRFLTPIPPPSLSVQWIAVNGEIPFEADAAAATSKGPSLQNLTLWRRSPGDGPSSPEPLPLSHLPQEAILRLDAALFAGLGKGKKDEGIRPAERMPSEVLHVERIDHRLSKEHTLFLSQVRNVIRSALENLTKEAEDSVENVINSLKSDPGSPQLIPYFIFFAANELRARLQAHTEWKPSAFRLLVRFLGALIENPFARLQHYMHQILHALLSVVLDPLFGLGSPSIREVVAIRRLAARKVAIAVFSHQVHSATLLKRILGIYHQHLQNFLAPLPTICGALQGIRALGRSMVRKYVLPILPMFVSILESTEALEHVLRRRKQSTTEGIFDARRAELRTYVIHELMGSVSDSLDSSDGAHPLFLNPPQDRIVDETFQEAVVRLNALAGDRHLPFLTATLHKSKQRDQKMPNYFPDFVESDRSATLPMSTPQSSSAHDIRNIVDEALRSEANQRKRKVLSSTISRSAKKLQAAQNVGDGEKMDLPPSDSSIVDGGSSEDFSSLTYII